jgi:glutathione synthase/RimK-type ligase-like ATP-grasp enzyme
MEVNEILQNFCNNHPHFFSNKEVFLNVGDFQNIQNVINKVEEKLSNGINYNKKVSGVFMSYDFHITDEGPKLIEINTNAGGSVLFRSFLEKDNDNVFTDDFKDKVLKMFEKEWSKSGLKKALKTIVILDENPEQQTLFTEFLLVQKILEEAGYEVYILDPKDLKLEKNLLVFNKHAIDMIYNRHTDFALSSPVMSNIRNAYENRNVVLTPNPEVYETFANKKHLVTLSQDEYLKKFVPYTVLITDDNKDDLWTRRKKLFFKPLNGHGSKSVYCGKKITTKAWQEITKAKYIAQTCTQPKRIGVMVNGTLVDMKYDLRFITYEGEILNTFGRLYSGQATYKIKA